MSNEVTIYAHRHRAVTIPLELMPEGLEVVHLHIVPMYGSLEQATVAADARENILLTMRDREYEQLHGKPRPAKKRWYSQFLTILDYMKFKPLFPSDN